MSKLLIKIPTRERGFDWLYAYMDNITNPETRVFLTLDADHEQPFVYDWGEVRKFYGYSKSKVDAYNRDFDKIDFDWDIVMLGSDDMIPQVKGFDQIIIDDMKNYSPDGDGCLWYHTEDHEAELQRRYKRYIQPGSDFFYQKWVCMLPIMGRKYYDRFGYVYHPSYKSFWCDNEFTEVAYRDKKIQYIHNQIIKHYHPAWETDPTYGKDDDLYSRNNPNWHSDMNNYRMRKSKGFPI